MFRSVFCGKEFALGEKFMLLLGRAENFCPQSEAAIGVALRLSLGGNGLKGFSLLSQRGNSAFRKVGGGGKNGIGFMLVTNGKL